MLPTDGRLQVQILQLSRLIDVRLAYDATRMSIDSRVLNPVILHPLSVESMGMAQVLSHVYIYMYMTKGGC